MRTGIEPKPAPLDEVSRYYAERITRHGPCAQGVDWNGADGQRLRFAQVLRIVPPGQQDYTLTQIGCGYGALAEWLTERGDRFDYCGIDISPEMIAAAQARFGDRPDRRFLQGATPPGRSDYCVASGIFNVRLNATDDAWEAHVLSVLDLMAETGEQGFAFNCLTSYSDAHRMEARLYYADPARMFDLCMRRYGRHVALLHDYGLYEFTILVRRFS